MSAILNPAGKEEVTILVVGDGGVGKSSLISSLVSSSWDPHPPIPVMQPVMVAAPLMPEKCQLNIVDTSSDPEHQSDLLMYLCGPSSSSTSTSTSSSSRVSSTLSSSLRADCIILVVSEDLPTSFSRVESHWLPLIEGQTVAKGGQRIPIIIAINKSAREEERSVDEEDEEDERMGGRGADLNASFSSAASCASSFDDRPHPFQHLLHSFRISNVVRCSAKYMYHLSPLFYMATRMVLSPTEALVDLPTPIHATAAAASSAQHAGLRGIQPKVLTQRALLRIFRLFDDDRDGVLDMSEMDRMHQVNFSGKRLTAAAYEALIEKLKKAQERTKDYVRLTTAARKLNDERGGRLFPNLDVSAAPIGCIGVTFSGVLYMHCLFLEKLHRMWNTWDLLYLFGYGLGATRTAQMSATITAASQATTTPSAQHGRGSSTLSTQQPQIGHGTGSRTSSIPPAPSPTMGNLFLKESNNMCKLPFAFQPHMTYELSPLAVHFLTLLFGRFDADKDGLWSIRPDSSKTDALASPIFLPSNTPSSSRLTPMPLCTIQPSSDLENAFASCPSIPFQLPSFIRNVVTLAPNRELCRRNGASNANLADSHLTLDGWLACWALLLYRYSNTNLPGSLASATSTSHPSTAHSKHGSSLPTASMPATPPSIPNPDTILRYLAYLCYPVTLPGGMMVGAADFFQTTDAQPSTHQQSTQQRKGAKSNHSSSAQMVPCIQRCLHVVPRESTDAARRESVRLHDQLLSMDPAASTARHAAFDAHALKPSTVSCLVVGASGVGKKTFIDCMLGRGNMSSMSQPLTSDVVAGLSSALGQDGPSVTIMPPTPSSLSSASGSSSSSSSFSSAAASPSMSEAYAARLPLQHLPPTVATSHVNNDGASNSKQSTLHQPNRFLIMHELPASMCHAYLSSSSFTSTSFHLVLILFDGSDMSSVQFAQQALQSCFQRRAAVLLIQSKIDFAHSHRSVDRATWTQLDVEPMVWKFSAREFWREWEEGWRMQMQKDKQLMQEKATGGDVKNGTSSSNHSAAAAQVSSDSPLLIFERIYQAARNNSPYVLTSLSASRRSSPLWRRCLPLLGWSSLALLSVAGVTLAWAAQDERRMEKIQPLITRTLQPIADLMLTATTRHSKASSTSASNASNATISRTLSPEPPMSPRT